MVDEGGDAVRDRREEVVFQQDAVLQGLVPALDLALRLGMIGRAANMLHALAVEPGGEVGRDVGSAVVAQQPGSMSDRDLVEPDAASARSSVAVTSSARIVAQSFQATMKREKSSSTVER